MKFCCPDLAPEWEKVSRLLEAEQYQACLHLIEQWEKQRPDRPCLLATKILIFLSLRRLQEAAQVVEHFLEKHPENPVALLEKAYITALEESSTEAFPWLMRGLEKCEHTYPPCTLRVLPFVATGLVEEERYCAGRALIRLATNFSSPQREDYQEWADQLDGDPDIPLVLREGFVWRPNLLANTPAAEAFQQVHQKMIHGHWLSAAEQLRQLTETYPQEPGLWWHLAVLRVWLLDIPGALEALRRYGSLGVSEEEAILAEAVAIALSPDPLGDRTSQYELHYTPEDEITLQTALSLSKQVVQYQGEIPLRRQDGEVPPRALYFLLDRPVPPPDQTPSEENWPNILALAALFGRQTDRDARLEVYRVYDGNRLQIESLLEQFVEQGLRPNPVVEKIADASATQCCFWWDTLSVAHQNHPTDSQWEEEIQQKRFFDRWVNQPLGIFEGISPRQAAQNPQYKNRLEAVLLWVEYLATRSRYPLERDRLRQELGLPPRQPIDPERIPLRTVPLYRWTDIDLNKVSDSEITEGFLYASHFRWAPAVERFANTIVQKTTLVENPVWLSACYYAAMSALPSDQAGTYIEQGRQRALQARLSCAPWDLLEIRYHLQRREPQPLDGLVRHILQQHQYEPGVLERLMEILAPYGFFSPEESQQQEQGAGFPEETSGLWTPDNKGAPNAPKKLWTPDMS